MKNFKRDDFAKLLLFLAVILGGWVRFYPSILAGFPINDGGMFYIMIQELRANAYKLPAITSYNFSGIPYAYPPLGFYLVALVSDLTKTDVTQILGWMPALISTFSILAFYRLSTRLTFSRFQASLATILFALMPRAIATFISGGGLTRSLGQLFMLLTLASVIDLYRSGQKRHIGYAALFGSLTVLSHPEAIVFTVSFSFVSWFFLSRSWNSLRDSLLVSLAVILLTSPWWLTVLFSTGVHGFVSALQTGGSQLAIFNLLFLTFLGEPFATLMTALGLLGIIIQLIRKDYFWLVWLVLPFIVDGRSATTVAVIPFALLAALALDELILPALHGLNQKLIQWQAELISMQEIAIIICLIFYSLVSAQQAGIQLASNVLSVGNREAMTWVKGNTSAGARFLVLTGALSPVCDPVAEWFPALASRHSVMTIQGTEWLLGKRFGSFLSEASDLQSCLYLSDDCLGTWLAKNKPQFDYLYVSKKLVADDCKPLTPPPNFSFFFDTLSRDPNYQSVFDSDSVAIYRQR